MNPSAVARDYSCPSPARVECVLHQILVISFLGVKTGHRDIKVYSPPRSFSGPPTAPRGTGYTWQPATCASSLLLALRFLSYLVH